MEDKRRNLIFDLQSKFAEEFRISLKPFNAEEKIDVLELLFECAKRMERKEDYEQVYQSCIDPILTKYKSKARDLFNLKLTEYFFQDSLKLFDLMYELKINDLQNQTLSDEEYNEFIRAAKNLIFNERHFIYLSMSSEVKKEPTKDEILQGLQEELKANKEYTTRRQTLFFHYLNEHFRFCVDKKPLSEVIHFLTDKSQDNIYKILLHPLKGLEDGPSSKKELKKDLEYVKSYFQRIGAVEITKIIDQDLREF